MSLATNSLKRLCALALVVAFLPLSAFAQASPAGYTFRAQSEIVLVNVTVRDRNGNLLRDLKQDDFTVLEDNKPQQIVSMDLENTDTVQAPELPQMKVLSTPSRRPARVAPTETQPLAQNPLKDRRLIVLFFDLTSMQPDEIDRAATAAQNFVDKQMAPADLVAVVSLGNSLQVNHDFTSDREQLKKVLSGFNAGAGQGYEAGSTGSTEGTPDTGQSFTVDDTEYNIFNTDRRLQALRSVAAQLSRVDQKKSLIYFSSGMSRTGLENQSQLRAAVNAAVRANVAIYTADIRGLQALVPGGDASQASLRGTSAYSGRATENALDANFSSQETLVTLAGDTGGRAFLDTNDFGKVFKGVQDDTSSYYVLSYHSTNPARDGRYRHITVRVNRPGVKLEYRKGYYAPADFKHTSKDDRERQLEEELASELPNTDLPVYLATGYFRVGSNRFYVPVSVLVPGSEIPFTRNSDQDKATLDIVGLITDPQRRPFDQVRDTVKLSVNTAQQVRRKNVQYNTGFVLPPGKYHLKFVLRENETGRLGSFETDITLPDLKKTPLKMSSIVLASQIQPAAKKQRENPLSHDGSEIVPSVTRVFSAGQHLYLYYEVYDPGRAKSPDNKSGIHLLTNVTFFQGKAKVYETPLVEAKEINVSDRGA
ncbi:MAG: VWA domain-containing protein, partial [Acidobacteria bacterium]|nr:VWA domain-containing protein [Acidobacteriota bacterium]